MHVLRISAPSLALRQYVRYYANREAHLGSGSVVHPIPARATHVVEFSFGDLYKVCSCETGLVKAAHPIVVVGVQTYRRVQLFVHGNVDSFAIFFESTGLQQLFNVPVRDLTNRDEEACAVLGQGIARLGQRLGTCRSFLVRVQMADEFLTNCSLHLRDAGSISQAAEQLRITRGCSRIDALANKTGMGLRQFQRRFQDAVGVPPKTFSRIVRFEAALEIKGSSPSKSWTDVAHELGYHDHMHLVHDFQQLSGAAPTGILPQLEAVFQSEPGPRVRMVL
jgi:AraC-like DNA-binding protein